MVGKKYAKTMADTWESHAQASNEEQKSETHSFLNYPVTLAYKMQLA